VCLKTLAPLSIITTLLTNYPVGTRIRNKAGLTPLHTALQFGRGRDVFDAVVKAAEHVKEDVMKQVRDFIGSK